MLKIKRLSFDQREFPVRLGGRGAGINKRSASAFGIALTIHLMAIFLIKVVYSEHRIIPERHHVVVQAHLGSKTPQSEEVSLPKITQNLLALQKRLGAGAAFPELPQQEIPRRERRHAYRDDSPLLPSHEFDAIEYQYQSYAPPPMEFGFTRLGNPVTLHVAGSLADIGIAKDGLSAINSRLRRYPKKGGVRTTFRVQVDNKTGAIFWFHRGSGVEQQQKLSQLAERILRRIRFDKNPLGFVTEGEIELLFKVDLTDEYEQLIADLDAVDQEVSSQEQEIRL